jgi:hypothetical protein
MSNPNAKGRPRMFSKSTRRSIASLLRKHGLKGTQDILWQAGVVLKKGEEPTKVPVSIPTLKRIADENEITFSRGRPAQKEAA